MPASLSPAAANTQKHRAATRALKLAEFLDPSRRQQRAGESHSAMLQSLPAVVVKSPVAVELLSEPARALSTLMIRNLPRRITQQELKDDLDESFPGLYDFLYMPSEFADGKGKGYAFVNFTSGEAAGCLIGAWHLKRRFGVSSSEPPLNITAASVQGREANLAKFSNPRLRRIKNPSYRPCVVAPVSTEIPRAKYDSNVSIVESGLKTTRRASCDSGGAVPLLPQPSELARCDFNSWIAEIGRNKAGHTSHDSRNAEPLQSKPISLKLANLLNC